MSELAKFGRYLDFHPLVSLGLRDVSEGVDDAKHCPKERYQQCDNFEIILYELNQCTLSSVL